MSEGQDGGEYSYPKPKSNMADYQTIKKRARELRKNQTPQEKLLWEALRNRKLDGFKFNRQRPLIFQGSSIDDHYIMDFYCAARKLCIEIDGKSHDGREIYDSLRDQTLLERGIRTVRIRNEEFRDLDSVIQKIRRELVEE